jgi:hypothetical protein
MPGRQHRIAGHAAGTGRLSEIDAMCRAGDVKSGQCSVGEFQPRHSTSAKPRPFSITRDEFLGIPRRL